MIPKVCIYTSICGGYDDLKAQPEQSIPCDFVCFTDEPERLAGTPWRVAPVQASPGSSARLSAKAAKVLPHSVLGDRYDVSIWIDGSIQILRSSFAETLVASTRETGFAALRHPDRTCVYDELRAAQSGPAAHKYRGQPVQEQVEAYRAAGYPDAFGLLAGGVIARDMRNPTAREISERWWVEINTWSLQDQLSLPFVLWSLGARATVLELDLWRNPFFEVWPHFDASNDDLLIRTRPEYRATSFQPVSGGAALATYDPRTGAFVVPSAGDETLAFPFGPGGADLVPLFGDWDGDGEASPGLYDPATGSFLLRNERTPGPADVVFTFGPPHAVPVVGDWSGEGRDSVGVYLPESGYWALRLRPEAGAADLELSFGEGGKGLRPVAGDWDGRGRDRVGLYEPGHATWFLLDELRTGARVTTFSFGAARATPIAGDWNGDGIDEIGTFVPEQSLAHLAAANTPGSECWRALVDPIGGIPLAVATPTRSGVAKALRYTANPRNLAPDGTPERIVPDDLIAAPDHLARYVFAAHWAPARRVLDLCCGVGYGSNLLAAAGARHVIGLDVACEAVADARSRYASAGVEFLVADATGELPATNFDLVVCFEGLEHVDRPDLLLRNVASALAPGGTALVSTPNGAHYRGGHSGNPYHVREPGLDEFAAMLRTHFSRVEIFCQREPDTLSSEHTPLAYRPELVDPMTVSRREPFVWIALCRDPIPTASPSA